MRGHQIPQHVEVRLGSAAKVDAVEVPVQIQRHMAILTRGRPDGSRQTRCMYDVADGKWSTLAPMPTPRHAGAVATVGNTVYCIGGANRPTREGPLAAVEALDFR